ncbi:MAG: biotin transporter BioY [Acholeplasmatales bacterium]|nr:biotin transporter BioY [Acholeplasmatales bacterium]
MAMSLCLLIISSKIAINIGIIDMTLQTFSVIIISLILKYKKAFIVFFTYIIMGLIGFNVFSNGGGIYYVLKPSFGFILGFLLSSIVVGSNFYKDKKIAYYIKAVLGLLIIDIVGLIYMYMILNIYMDKSYSIMKILSIGLLPFIVKDIISVSISAFVAYRLNPYLQYNMDYEYTDYDKNISVNSNKS